MPLLSVPSTSLNSSACLYTSADAALTAAVKVSTVTPPPDGSAAVGSGVGVVIDDSGDRQLTLVNAPMPPRSISAQLPTILMTLTWVPAGSPTDALDVDGD